MKNSGVLHLAVIGAIVSTLCDANHVHTGTLTYPEPWLFGQAWWVFPNFFLAFLGMGYVYLLLAEYLPPGIVRQKGTSGGSARELIETMATFVFVYLLSGFGNREPALLSAIFYVSFFVRWFFSYERKWLLLLAIMMGIGGMAGEGAMSAAGMVAYTHVDVFHVPFWLGGLYMHGTFALREGMCLFVYKPSDPHGLSGSGMAGTTKWRALEGRQ